MKLVIANGYVIDPAQEINAGRNLLVEDGRVVECLIDRNLYLRTRRRLMRPV